MDETSRIKWVIRVAVLLASAYWFFAVMLPNASPYPEMQPNAEAARRAEQVRADHLETYLFGYAMAAFFVVLGALLRSRVEWVGWIVLVALSLYPVVTK